MEMPQLTAEQKKLQRLAGDWLGEENIHPSPYDPEGGPAVGRVKNRVALNGLAVIQDYEEERNGEVNLRGHGIFRYDADAGQYVLTWIDSSGFPPAEFRGGFEGDLLTLSSPNGPGASRAVFDLGSEGSGTYQYRMEISPDGDQWMTFVDGVYTRQAG